MNIGRVTLEKLKALLDLKKVLAMQILSAIQDFSYAMIIYKGTLEPEKM